jgi:hypothetical protein
MDENGSRPGERLSTASFVREPTAEAVVRDTSLEWDTTGGARECEHFTPPRGGVLVVSCGFGSFARFWIAGTFVTSERQRCDALCCLHLD